jgi:hypothetical protein
MFGIAAVVGCRSSGPPLVGRRVSTDADVALRDRVFAAFSGLDVNPPEGTALNTSIPIMCPLSLLEIPGRGYAGRWDGRYSAVEFMLDLDQSYIDRHRDEMGMALSDHITAEYIAPLRELGFKWASRHSWSGGRLSFSADMWSSPSGSILVFSRVRANDEAKAAEVSIGVLEVD